LSWSKFFLFIDARVICSPAILWYWLIGTQGALLLMPSLTEDSLSSLVGEEWRVQFSSVLGALFSLCRVDEWKPCCAPFKSPDWRRDSFGGPTPRKTSLNQVTRVVLAVPSLLSLPYPRPNRLLKKKFFLSVATPFFNLQGPRPVSTRGAIGKIK